MDNFLKAIDCVKIFILGEEHKEKSLLDMKRASVKKRRHTKDKKKSSSSKR